MRARRVSCKDIRCSLGKVVNISTGGIRLRTRRRHKVGDPVAMRIEFDGDRLELFGEVLRARTPFFGRSDVAIEFREVPVRQFVVLKRVVERIRNVMISQQHISVINTEADATPEAAQQIDAAKHAA